MVLLVGGGGRRWRFHPTPRPVMASGHEEGRKKKDRKAKADEDDANAVVGRRARHIVVSLSFARLYRPGT